MVTFCYDSFHGNCLVFTSQSLQKKKEHSGHSGHFDYSLIKLFHSHGKCQISGKDNERYANAKIKTVL